MITLPGTPSTPRPSLLGDRRFVLLVSARTVSVPGNGFARVTLAFGVLDLPGTTPGKLPSVLVCQALPQLVFILAGGVIADRMSRSRPMVMAELVGCMAYAGLATMVLTGHAPLAAMCATAAPAGVATALFQPAMDGVIPEIVPAERLQQASGPLRTGANSSLLLGLALSGMTVALVGAGWVPALNAGSFLTVLATFPAAGPIALLSARAPVVMFAAAMFAACVATDVFGVLWATTIQRGVPGDSISRVSSYDWFGSLAFAPLGLVVAGPVADAFDLTGTLAGCALLVALSTLAALMSPQVLCLAVK